MRKPAMALVPVLVLQLVLPSLAWADPPPTPAPLTPVPPGNDNIAVVRKGDPAPFDGQLFDQPTAIRWANYLQQSQARLRLDPLYQYKLDQVEIQGLQKTVSLERDEYARVTKDLQDKLVSSEKARVSPPFYETFWFGMTVGIVASIGLVAGSVAVLNAAK
jgi:hypothetical protein